MQTTTTTTATKSAIVDNFRYLGSRKPGAAANDNHQRPRVLVESLDVPGSGTLPYGSICDALWLISKGRAAEVGPYALAYLQGWRTRGGLDVLHPPTLETLPHGWWPAGTVRAVATNTRVRWLAGMTWRLVTTDAPHRLTKRGAARLRGEATLLAKFDWLPGSRERHWWPHEPINRGSESVRFAVLAPGVVDLAAYRRQRQGSTQRAADER